MKVKLRLDLDTGAGRAALRAYLDAVEGRAVPAAWPAPSPVVVDWDALRQFAGPATAGMFGLPIHEFEPASGPAGASAQQEAALSTASEPLGSTLPYAPDRLSLDRAGTGSAEPLAAELPARSDSPWDEAAREAIDAFLDQPVGPQPNDEQEAGAGEEAEAPPPAEPRRSTLEAIGRRVEPAPPVEEAPLPGAHPDPDPAPPADVEPRAPVDQMDVMGGGEPLDPKRALTDPDRLYIIARHKAGDPPSAIARLLGRDRQQVQNYITNVKMGRSPVLSAQTTAVVRVREGALTVAERRPMQDPQVVEGWRQEREQRERETAVSRSYAP